MSAKKYRQSLRVSTNIFYIGFDKINVDEIRILTVDFGGIIVD